MLISLIVTTIVHCCPIIHNPSHRIFHSKHYTISTALYCNLLYTLLAPLGMFFFITGPNLGLFFIQFALQLLWFVVCVVGR